MSAVGCRLPCVWPPNWPPRCLATRLPTWSPISMITIIGSTCSVPAAALVQPSGRCSPGRYGTYPPTPHVSSPCSACPLDRTLTCGAPLPSPVSTSARPATSLTCSPALTSCTAPALVGGASTTYCVPTQLTWPVLTTLTRADRRWTACSTTTWPLRRPPCRSCTPPKRTTVRRYQRRLPRRRCSPTRRPPADGWTPNGPAWPLSPRTPPSMAGRGMQCCCRRSCFGIWSAATSRTPWPSMATLATPPDARETRQARRVRCWASHRDLADRSP
jgi:hypothetical protein